jgi:hypothetical protein
MLGIAELRTAAQEVSRDLSAVSKKTSMALAVLTIAVIALTVLVITRFPADTQ